MSRQDIIRGSLDLGLLVCQTDSQIAQRTARLQRFEYTCGFTTRIFPHSLANPLNIPCDGRESILARFTARMRYETSADSIARNAMVLNLLYELCSVSSGEVLFARMTLIGLTVKFLASTTFQI